jgi:hypothetical protein
MVCKEKYIMAIYPYTNTYVINKDAVAGSQFKAGMVLMMNADGKAVPADSQLLVFNSLGQKLAKILGLAAGDSNLTGNTIIVPDTVGNNYLDENKNFVNASNAEYVAIKRQLLDYADETINEYYNMNFSPIPKRRGIGVYSLTGDTFATDQFNAVLHGDYGVDSTDTISFSPGDLLTFGGGVNAGKLVKINTNSFGPDLVVVGIVEKYNSNIGLLYFRYILDNVSFGSNNKLDYDMISPLAVSGSTVYDFSGTQTNGTLTNGLAYSSTPYPSLFFDGTNDYINISNSYSANFQNGVTIDFWVRYNGNGNFERIIDINNGPSTVVMCIFRFGTSGQLGLATAISPFTNLQTAGMLSNSNVIVSGTIQNFTFVIGPGAVGSTAPYNNMYLNGVLVPTSDYLTGRSQIPDVTNRTFWIGRTPFNDAYLSANLFSVKIYNQPFSADRVLNQHNATKSRYGL